MQIVSKYHSRVYDMGQSVTHGLLSLSILLGIETSEDDGAILKDLLFEAKKLGLSLDFQIIENDYKKPEHFHRHVLSCVAPDLLTSAFIAELATALAKHKINILRIDGLTPDFNSVEITTSSAEGTPWNDVKEDVLAISNRHKIDVAIMKDNVYRRNKRLIVFDMDSTLIQIEVIDEMAKLFGKADQITKITERAMNGEMDFKQSLIKRVELLKGLMVSDLSPLIDNLPLTLGVPEFISTVKKLGFKVGLISGGFTLFSNKLKETLNLDYAFANELEIKNGCLTGKLVGPIIDAEQKATIMNLMAQQENISLEQVVAVGDGANDLPMLSRAGLGIAFHAKEMVKRKSDHNLSHGPMTSILYFLGIPGSQN
jgi:phosphoserine phosphatase